MFTSERKANYGTIKVTTQRFKITVSHTLSCLKCEQHYHIRRGSNDLSWVEWGKLDSSLACERRRTSGQNIYLFGWGRREGNRNDERNSLSISPSWGVRGLELVNMQRKEEKVNEES